jgi:hypothetical protein
MSTKDEYKVSIESLNLRSEPVVKDNTRIAVLYCSHPVTKIGETADNQWWKVSAVINQIELEGFVTPQDLVRSSGFVELAMKLERAGTQIPPVHLKENKPGVTRNSMDLGAFPLGEPGRPQRSGSTPVQKVAELQAIIDWLDVEESLRYHPHDDHTYCNIYAYDYCYLGEVYLPRVWWSSDAIAKWSAGSQVTPLYGRTLLELSANRLFDWLGHYGESFGWQRLFDLTTLQDAVNQGEVGVLCAKRKVPNAPGHISVAVPETSIQKAQRSNGKVIIPLQSQAGSNNHKYYTQRWWNSSKFADFGFWRHT